MRIRTTPRSGRASVFRSGFLVFVGAAAIVLAAALVGPPRPSTDPWRPSKTFARALVSASDAADVCASGTASVKTFWLREDPQGVAYCVNNNTLTKAKYRVLTYCDGSVSPVEKVANRQCFVDSGCPLGWMEDEGQFLCTPPPSEVVTICESACREPEPCCSDERQCPDCVGKPISLPADGNYPGNQNTYILDVFPLDPLPGFPPAFRVFWNGRGRVLGRPPLGLRATHTFALFLWKGEDENGSDRARIQVDDGSIESFRAASGWTAEDGRKDSLVAGPFGPPVSGTCSGVATLTREDGTKYEFYDYCDGTEPQEGLPIRITRPSGEELTFEITGRNITAVENRLGARITFSYDGIAGMDASWGELTFVTSPRGDVFTFRTAKGLLKEIKAPGDVPLWTLDHDAENLALIEVRDARNRLENGWTYATGSPAGVTPLTECGPGECTNTVLTFTPVGSDRVDVSFLAADGQQRANSYTWNASSSDSQPHVTVRTQEGVFPNSGNAALGRAFVPGTNIVSVTQDANGFLTVYANHDAHGNPGTVTEGCSGSLSAPDCSAGRTTSFLWKAGTRTWVERGRASVSGSTVYERREFDDASTTRVKFHRLEGRTATALDGAINPAVQTRSVKYTWNGLDLQRIDGPYFGTGEPPGDGSAPLTEFAYYGPTDADECGGTALPANTGFVRSVSRFVDGTRALVTRYCDYEAGRPRKIKNPDGSVTRLTYDWRGSVTQMVVDDGASSLTTDYTRDENGNLTEVRLPLADGTNRSGWKYVYDDADRMTSVQRGYFSGSSFTPLQQMTFVHDHWGNRTRTEYKDAAGTVVVSEEATYDAFNRMVCLARPASGDCASNPTRTSFEYDLEGNLRSVSDAQGDDVKYGSLADITRYNAFGKLEKVRQKVCSHTDPNGTCSGAYADVEYAYDAALQLSEVLLKDVRGSDIATSYTTDDFGNVVKIVSPDSGTSVFRYDAAGRLVESEDARGKRFAYVYDRLGRLVEKRNTTGTPVTEVRYCYDGYDLACGFLDAPGDAGQLTAVDDKPGGIELDYDAAGRLVEERRTFSSTFVTRYVHDDNGNVIETQRPPTTVQRRRVVLFAFSDQFFR